MNEETHVIIIETLAEKVDRLERELLTARKSIKDTEGEKLLVDHKLSVYFNRMEALIEPVMKDEKFTGFRNSMSEYNKFLEVQKKLLSITDKDTEIVRLRDEKITNDSWIARLNKENESAHTIIKEREAESTSYRDQYNELKDAVYSGVSKPFSQSKTRAEVLYELKNINNKIKHQEKIIELARESDERLYKWGHHWQRKYKRFFSLLSRKADKGNFEAAALIVEFYENEDKYAKKVK